MGISLRQGHISKHLKLISMCKLGKDHLLAGTILLIVLVFFYRDIVFEHRTFLQLGYTAGTMPYSAGGGAYGYPGSIAELRGAPADSAANAWVNEPYSRRAGAIVMQGEVPLWNPSQGMGEPFLADGNSAPLEPIQFISGLIPEKYWPITTDIQVLFRFFLAGFFTYLFARSIGLQLLPSVFAGSAFMLTSYFVAFGNHPQMRAETLLPFVLYSYERLAKKAIFASVILGAVSTAWVIIASFPESGFLVLVLSGCWYVYRCSWKAYDVHFIGSEVRRIIIGLFVAISLGLALSAFFILPLMENIQTSLHIHEKGVGLASYPGKFAAISLMAGILPNAGWIPHFYTVIFVLGFIGLSIGSFVDSRRRIIWFFALYGLIFYLKIYGFVLVQWIGLLPGFNQILLPKYLSPSVSLCFAILAAFGIEQIIKRKVSYRYLFILLLVFFFLITLIYLSSDFDSQKVVTRTIFVTCVATAVCAIAAIGRTFRFKGSYATGLLLVVLVGEAAAWHKGIIRPIRYDPFTPPPYVQFLRQQNEDYRIFGFDRIMQPGISTAYNIDDVRFIAALVSEERYLFVNQFLAPGAVIPENLMKPGEFFSDDIPRRVTAALLDPASTHGVDLVDKIKFQGIEAPLYLGKFFDLLNMKYVLATTDSQVIDQINITKLPSIAALLQQNQATAIQTLSINSEVRQGVVIRPSSQITIPLLLPAGKVSLDFGMGVNPSTVQHEQAPAASVRYKVLVTDQQGEHEVFQRLVAPHGWQDVSVDLSLWSGKRVTLTFVIDGEQSGAAKGVPGYLSIPILQMQNPLSTWARQNLQSVDTISLKLALLENNFSKEGPVMGNSSITIDGKPRNSLFLLPDSIAPLPVQIPDAATRLTFAIALDPQVWTKENAGDGVRYHVIVKNGSTETEVFNRYIDPKHNLAERHWIDAVVDLSQWRGKRIILEFATDRGPIGDGTWDLAHWSNIQLIGQGVGLANPEIAHFQLVYDNEIQIYRNNFAYPRAFVVHNVELARGIDESIRELAQPDFDPSSQAVVDISSQSDSAGRLEGQVASTTPTAARIVQHTANTMRITTNLEQPGLLVISETYNAGWKAYVDGVAVPVQKVNLFMQGVYLDAGNHVVEMVYAPSSFTIGTMISITAVVGIIIAYASLIVVKRRTR